MNVTCKCGKLFRIKPSRSGAAKYCSYECCYSDRRKQEWLFKAAVLHCFYRFGAKRIAKELKSVSYSAVLAALKHHGIFNHAPSPEPPKAVRKDLDPIRLIMRQYGIEARQAAKWDEQRHWENHHQVRLFRARSWASANKPWIKKYKRDSTFKTNYLIASRIRSRVRNVLKGIKKSAPTIRLLGCKLTEFRDHIERRFAPGMSWQNYGEWHIDHIKPCAAFDLRQPQEQQRCFHYSNLQPLWALDNIRKGAR